MNRDQLLAELLAEQFGRPVPEWRGLRGEPEVRALRLVHADDEATCEGRRESA